MLLPVAAALTVVLAQANPAAAGNDDFEVWTNYDRYGFAGIVRFVDYGPGAPGGGNNDDYLEIYDNHPDGHGVQVWAWLHGKYLDTKYHGAGSTNNPVYFDPYAIFPKNVAAGERIGVKICLVDGINNLIEDSCGSFEWQSIDG
ncbi:hypothetical protein ACQPWW_20945 [Micromonospora sp. CA-240977]|uniref:hypothetical protein n=1 Tax=Micromonospora sp. CA-240977 TaxID=3239957 RepID=UPI003D8AD878